MTVAEVGAAEAPPTDGELLALARKYFKRVDRMIHQPQTS